TGPGEAVRDAEVSEADGDDLALVAAQHSHLARAGELDEAGVLGAGDGGLAAAIDRQSRDVGGAAVGEAGTDGELLGASEGGQDRRARRPLKSGQGREVWWVIPSPLGLPGAQDGGSGAGRAETPAALVRHPARRLLEDETFLGPLGIRPAAQGIVGELEVV